MKNSFPRIVIAGMAGDSGKTLVSLSILSELLRRGEKVAAFKKGPDFIDAAWLGLAAGSTARNLDIYLSGPDFVFRSFVNHAVSGGLNLIEGNRGLYDGMETGENSTAELAKLLKTPVIISMSPVKVTRTAAACLLGCIRFDPDVRIAGVILNKIAGKRHEQVVRNAIEETCGIPVLGAIPKLKNGSILPDRHLGLVTPEEAAEIAGKIEHFSSYCRDYIDIDRVLEIAGNTEALEKPEDSKLENPSKTVSIGYFSDNAFTFYYPENLESLEMAGAELRKISPLSDSCLPEIDALYIGGGFPETHAELLENNSSLRTSVKQSAEAGLPVYAECGGLMYLTRSLRWLDRTYSMADILPVSVEMSKKPQGHGYCEFEVDRENPFFPVGTKYRGHEFHYSFIGPEKEKIETVFALSRGTGCFDKRDGILYKNIVAGYTHLHAGGNGWAEGLVKAASDYKKNNNGGLIRRK